MSFYPKSQSAVVLLDNLGLDRFVEENLPSHNFGRSPEAKLVVGELNNFQVSGTSLEKGAFCPVTNV